VLSHDLAAASRYPGRNAGSAGDWKLIRRAAALDFAGKHPNMELSELQKTWETLGRDDPLWAVVSLPDKRNNGWDVEAFFATGEHDVDGMLQQLEQAGCPAAPGARVLDFGCGVGRLARAWHARGFKITGVDISSSMIEKGKTLLRDCEIEWVLNSRPDLSCFENGRFDLVTSLICLQHIPWEYSRRYIVDFGRIVRSGGCVLFQLPSTGGFSLAHLRRSLVDALPFKLGQRYRQWRRGSQEIFDMYFTPPAEVVRAAGESGLKLLQQIPHPNGGDSFTYIFRKQ
jgi:2-polyprenyl-3-methyl-5-hydroxy-6-metoxy-1,4-benzoquinol methylase